MSLSSQLKDRFNVAKSKVMFRIKKFLEEEFGATVVLNNELRLAQNGGEDSTPEDWERKMVRDTVWLLAE